MKKLFVCLVLVCVLLMAFTACNGEPIPGPQGPAGETGTPGKDGADGVSIIKTEIKDGELWITYSNAPDTPVSAGKVSENITINNSDSVPTTSSRGMEFSINDDATGYILTGIGTCTDKEIVVDTYNGLPVTRIEAAAFKNRTFITKVTLSNHITEINAAAFSGCTGLENINLPDGIKYINSNAFFGCTKLSDITIPNSVESIGLDAFNGCSSLTGVVIPDSVTAIGSGAFCDCTGLTTVSISKNIKEIEGDTFKNCVKLTNVIIPHGVTHIGTLFDGCDGLVSVTIPVSVKFFDGPIGYCASLEEVIYQGTTTQFYEIEISDWNPWGSDFWLEGDTCIIKCTDGDITNPYTTQ